MIGLRREALAVPCYIQYVELGSTPYIQYVELGSTGVVSITGRARWSACRLAFDNVRDVPPPFGLPPFPIYREAIDAPGHPGPFELAERSGQTLRVLPRYRRDQCGRKGHLS